MLTWKDVLLAFILFSLIVWIIPEILVRLSLVKEIRGREV